ncbi:acyltransferase [Burkholderia vietnamiensis]|nr:acyltransferase [Burkholderia vietnamiensis]
MGTFRLILAILVALSHLGLSLRGHNPGVMAVVCFYVISGYVMTALITKHYAAPSKFGWFFLDRAMRLYPQFLVYLAAGVVLVAMIHPAVTVISNVTPFKVVLNALMVPLNFYQLDVGGLGTGSLMPWSLGLEALFYAVIPIILIYQARQIALALSLAIFTMAYVGHINTDLFGYRFLPGTLFMFLAGSFLYNPGRAEKNIVVGIWASALVALLVVRNTANLQLDFNYEVLTGLLVAIPMVAILGKIKGGPIDNLLGNVSYGVFLNHPLLLYTTIGLGMPQGSVLTKASILGASVVLAWLTFRYVERPIVNARHRIRSREAPATSMEARNPTKPPRESVESTAHS